MKVYKTNISGWSVSEEFLRVLRELGFRSGAPSIPRGSHTGSFWLFGEDVDKMKEMMTKKFSSYEEYVKYLKEKGLALEAPKSMYNF